MCGIAGFIYPSGCQSVEDAEGIIRRMTDALRHRGPDGEGYWSDAESGVWFGHRRLAILDLSAHGRQPMLSSNARYVITYNGEIYNSPTLRRELAARGHAFRGTSDTEVLLAAVVEWGVEPAVRKLNGIFAFGLWDRLKHRLHLVRDRLGIKPLYYGWASDGTFLFGSELKALRLWPTFDHTLDHDAMVQFFRRKYIPDPLSIYASTRKLAPGNTLVLGPSDLAARTCTVTSYWSLMKEWARSESDLLPESEAVDAVEALLTDAVRLQTLSDVPVGALLSGGVDSSIIVALMQKISTRPVRTFTVGFGETAYNEAPMAKAVAAHLGTDHTEIYVTPDDALRIVPQIPLMWDEPFADSSQIPTHLICKLAQQHITVVLSGDGGDELFGGYPRYPEVLAMWRQYRWAPPVVRRRLATVLLRMAQMLWSGNNRSGSLSARICEWLPTRIFQRAGEQCRLRSFREFYEWAIAEYQPPGGLVVGLDGSSFPLIAEFAPTRNLRSDMQYIDTVTYLPGDILVKVDRASMAVGLEARVPLLDHRMVELAARLPPPPRIHRREGKWVLKQLLSRYVPSELTDRPKMGFGVPVGPWLRGPLREWGEDLLSDDRLKREGYLKPGAVRHLWNEHLSGRRDHSYVLWSVLVFELWLRTTKQR